MKKPPHERSVGPGETLDLSRRLSERDGFEPYLVGGPVRDRELGLALTDVDLTVERRAPELSQALAQELGGTVRSHPRFLTFKVLSPSAPTIDIATSRREIYSRPGALPTVEPAPLIEDLRRRDYSINAIALDLKSGRTIDPLQGLGDLRAGLLRSLHPRSFLDDPTRILRGIRLATRLGFRFQTETEARVRAAIEAGAIRNVTRERTWREILMAIDEPDPAAVLQAMMDWGVLGEVTRAADTSYSRLPRVESILRSFPTANAKVVWIGAMLDSSTDPSPALSGTGLSSKQRAMVARIVGERRSIASKLASARSEKERLNLCRGLAPELLVSVAAESDDARVVVERCQRISDVRLPFRGHDLGVPPGPHLALALQQTREALLLGEVAPENSLAFARDLALQYLRQQEPQVKGS